MLIGYGEGGEIVCFLGPMGRVCLGTITWGKEVGISRETILGGEKIGIQPEGVWERNVNLDGKIVKTSFITAAF